MACERLEDRTLLTLGGPFLVNTVTAGAQIIPAAASSANGAKVVVWEDLSAEPDVIKAQRYNASGDAVGGEITVAPIRSFFDSNVSAAMDAAGNFVVVYSDLAVSFARYDADGDLLGSGTVGKAGLDKYRQSVAMDAAGNFVVAYEVIRSSGNWEVFADRFAADGTRLKTFKVSASKEAAEGEPSVAMSADGRFAIAYAKVVESGEKVFVRRYTSTGTLIKKKLLGANQEGGAANPSAGMNDQGNAVVAWNSGVDNGSILARQVSSTGALGLVVTIRATPAFEAMPRVAMDRSDGDFVVGYVSGSGMGVTEVSAAGVVGETTSFSTGRTGLDITPPALSIDGSDVYTVAYQSQSPGNADGDEAGIFARFGEL